MKCFVAFNLKPAVTREQYEEWFRTVNVPAIEQVKEVRDYHVWWVTGAMEGDPPYQVVEEMTIGSREAFERNLDEVPAVEQMLEQWYERVNDPVVIYAEEMRQS